MGLKPAEHPRNRERSQYDDQQQFDESEQAVGPRSLVRLFARLITVIAPVPVAGEKRADTPNADGE